MRRCTCDHCTHLTDAGAAHPPVVFAYEYVITLDQEVSLFWMRRKTGATWLFLLIRYMALLSLCLLNAATYAPMSDEVRTYWNLATSLG